MEKTRIKIRKKKAVAVLGSLATAIAAIYVVLVNVLVSAALVPSFMEKLEAFERITDESYAAQVQTSDIKETRQASLRKTKEWLNTAKHKKLTAQTEDGYVLAAEEFPAKEPVFSDGSAPQLGQESAASDDKVSHKWVLLLHGYTGWKEEMYPFAYWYHQEGYHVIAPDLRCQGESQGDYIGMGWTDRLDCMIWIRHILSEDQNAQIVLHGQSMGAAAALMMSGEEMLPENVKAVISDCAYTDAYSMFSEKIQEWFHLPAFPLVDSACLALRFRGGYNLKDASAIDAVARSETPTLFIHGDEDAMISVQMTKDLYQAASCPKELLIVKGAGHGQAQDKDPQTYYATIQAFLEKTLANTG